MAKVSTNARPGAAAVRHALLGTSAIVGAMMAMPTAAQTVTQDDNSRASWTGWVPSQNTGNGAATGNSGSFASAGTTVTYVLGTAGVFQGGSNGYSNGNGTLDGTTANAVVTYTFSRPVTAFNINYQGFDTC